MGNGKDEKILTCGYGLIGLCCSDCLLGPCRISPFEKDFQRGVCGDDADRIVVNRLIRTVMEEALEGLRGLKEAAERLSPRDSQQEPGRRPIAKERKRFLEKYGDPSGRSKKALNRYLSEEVEALLSPFSQRESLLLKNLFPEKAFPSLYQNSFPPGSLTGFLLDAVKKDLTEFPNIEKMLEQCLHVSIIPLIGEELKQDINRLLNEGGSSLKDQQDYEILKSLSPDPSPVLLLLTDEKISSREWVHKTAQDLEGSFEGKVLTLPLNGIGALREMGKRLSEKWFLPVEELKIVTLVSSPLAAWTLGPLAMGFSVISHPILPVHGSERVEMFFTEAIRKRFGNTYFLSWREDVIHAVHEFLR